MKNVIAQTPYLHQRAMEAGEKAGGELRSKKSSRLLSGFVPLHGKS